MSDLPSSFFGWVGFILQKYGSLFLNGVGVTLAVAITGTVLGFLLGLLVAILRTIPIPPRAKWYQRVPIKVLYAVLGVYIEVFRGTPMIVQAMVIYYGGMQMGMRLPVLTAAILIVSINTGAYMAEIIRGGIISVDKGQKEAAHAIGMTHWQSMVYVVLPQAVRNILPALGNEFIMILKETSLASTFFLGDLMTSQKIVAGATYLQLETLIIVGSIYLCITFPLSKLVGWFETKMSTDKSYKKRNRQRKLMWGGKI